MSGKKSLFVVLAIAVAMPVYAGTISVVELTGGDSGEGFSPLEYDIISVDLTPVVDQTDLQVQNVVFKPYGSQAQVAYTTGWPAEQNYTSGLPGTTTNDQNLAAVLDRQVMSYKDNAGIVIVVSGLIAGESYQVDLFSEYSSSTGALQWSANINGTTATISTADSSKPWLVTASDIIADVNGEITVTYGYDLKAYRWVNAISVTSSTVPEPITAGMLLLGGLLNLKFWRNRR